MVLTQLGEVDGKLRPLELVDLPTPVPNDDELLVAVRTCGVCHTELDEIEGRTPPPRLPVVLGHEIVGTVVDRGQAARRYAVGDRVGIGWIHSSSGGADENVSEHFQATGRDADGGYAEFTTVPERYAFAIPAAFRDEQAAPLLCAGAIGYRALKLAQLEDGNRIGLTGFGASAHLMLPCLRHQYPNSQVYVFARDPSQRQFALDLGADWAGDTQARPPQLLDAIIDTTPAWTPVLAALVNLRPGGRLIINAIRKEDRDKEVLLKLNYEQHLWMEREIKSVANITAADIAEFLPLAAHLNLAPTIQSYPLEDANQALIDLKRGQVRGAKVLRIRQDDSDTV